MAYSKRVRHELDNLEYYICTTIIPRQLGRVVYQFRYKSPVYRSEVINIIKKHGLTPIPIGMYRELQAKQDGRTFYRSPMESKLY